MRACQYTDSNLMQKYMSDLDKLEDSKAMTTLTQIGSQEKVHSAAALRLVLD